ncbi:SDR family oxidoreductase [Antrihabitans cavernicola]|uniref:SDR family oxidoreductase n=1 Tax=Antrihabitans cavernicola TaxID=2495913 RepID=A0A5A7S8X8_9NOCA|nr:SDR family oxidoreductase [Spelaeibacter cavernicola]KAA0021602.1 SDR family oxidoreductase [Spelaeibacter cavernicola]
MSNPTALIVGGTSGIGLATALKLQRAHGAEVHVAGRSRERLDTVAAAHSELVVHQADAGSRADIENLCRTIGTIDWLIVTVSGSDGVGPLADLDLDVLRRAFDAKFWAHITTVQAALPYLSGTGSITVIGATTARSGMPGSAGIASINGAVEALVKPLAVELAPIRVNGVSPGLVDTPWWSGLPDEAKAAYFTAASSSLPARRIATADDVADVVVLAATNPNTTGTIIETDGGARLVSVG